MIFGIIDEIEKNEVFRFRGTAALCVTSELECCCQPLGAYVRRIDSSTGRFCSIIERFTKMLAECILVLNSQVDSIFYLRRPDDLVAFLHQFDYRQTINAINAQLLALQMEITEKVQQSTFLYVIELLLRRRICANIH